MLHSDTPSTLTGANAAPRGPFTRPDELTGLVAYLTQNWGHDGYSLRLIGWIDRSNLHSDADIPEHAQNLLVAEASSSDGSRWHIGVDRYGNGCFLGAVR